MCASGPWRRLNNKWVSGWYGPWRDMASGLLLSSSIKVLMNGIPGATIQHRRVREYERGENMRGREVLLLNGMICIAYGGVYL
jgi:hypothetical protein